MTGARAYRSMAGWLLLASLAPMPFLYIVMPPFWIAAAVSAVLLLTPARTVRLSPLAQNAVAVLIVLLVLAAGGIRVGPLRPLGHLLLLLASVRALQIDSRRAFLRALPLIFLVWVVSLTSSTHVAVLVYFAVTAALWWWTGMQTHLMGVVRAPAAVRPWHAVTAAVAALLLAIPVFIAIPRLGSPWVSGRSGAQSVTGFSSRVDLVGVGRIQSSQERALVIRSPSGRTIEPSWTRLRATAFERVTLGSWAPRPPGRRQSPVVGEVEIADWTRGRGSLVELEITLDRPEEFLFLPEGTVMVDLPRPAAVDPAGGLALLAPAEEPLSYTVWVAPGAPPPRLDPPQRNALRFKPPTEVSALAGRVTSGLDSDAARAAAVESFLRSSFTYSLAGMGSFGNDPISWFLLRSRSGHCEYFAGGMVVLLDAVGVTARMVGGYSGGSAVSGGTEVVVREANAHTWVEVWLGPELGWRVYDPTPVANVPGLNALGARERLRFAWEWIQASWDRYVLTFGLAEQAELVAVVTERLLAPLLERPWRSALGASLVVVLVWVAARAGRLARTRSGRARSAPTSPSSRAVARLVGRLERTGIEVPPGATIRWISRVAVSRWPATARPVVALQSLAERELYGEERSPDGAAEVRRVWQELRRAMRDASPRA